MSTRAGSKSFRYAGAPVASAPALDDDASGYVVDKVLDCTANKGTGKMTVKQAADRGTACPTGTR